MYKPNRVTMSPQNEAIDPTIDNAFQFVFNGEVLSEYNINLFDLFTGVPIATQNVVVSPVKYNGQTISHTMPSAFWTTWGVEDSQMSYSIQCLGQQYTLSSTLGSDIVTIPNANYSLAEYVFMSSATIFGGTQDFYLVPTGNAGDYYAFMTIEAARNGLVIDRLVAATTDTSSIKAMVFSEQVPFRTAETPTLTLALVTATSATVDIIPTYTHPNGYSLNRYTFYLYDSAENLLLQTSEIFSSYANYTLENLAHGESFKVRFTGWSVLEQYVDTGMVVLNVTYDFPIPAKSYTVTATNDCDNGRMNVAIGLTPVQMEIGDIVPYDILNVTNILLYRQTDGEADYEIIALLPAATVLYHDYMVQSGKSYRYKVGFSGYVTTGIIWSGNFVAGNSVVTSYVDSVYYGWFLIDLDGDKSYLFDVQFEGGDSTQEDDFTKYKTNLRYNAYSVGNLRASASTGLGLISVDNLHDDFTNTNALLREIANLVSPSNTNRKIVKDRRTPTRIIPVFTSGYKETPLHNGVASQPYLCSFQWEQRDDIIE